MMRLEEIRRLIQLVEASEIGELEVRKWFTRVRISKSSTNGTGPAAVVSPAVSAAAAPATPPSSEPAAEESRHLVPITAPMVGTFYRAPAPDAESYVEEGTTIEPGQTVCIIEAMKLMNEIESDVRGRVQKILVPNASPVEFGQTLLLVDVSQGLSGKGSPQ